MPPQLLPWDETVLRLFTKTEGFAARCIRSSSWTWPGSLNQVDRKRSRDELVQGVEDRSEPIQCRSHGRSGTVSIRRRARRPCDSTSSCATPRSLRDPPSPRAQVHLDHHRQPNALPQVSRVPDSTTGEPWRSESIAAPAGRCPAGTKKQRGDAELGARRLRSGQVYRPVPSRRLHLEPLLGRKSSFESFLSSIHQMWSGITRKEIGVPGSGCSGASAPGLAWWTFFRVGTQRRWECGDARSSGPLGEPAIPSACSKPTGLLCTPP